MSNTTIWRKEQKKIAWENYFKRKHQEILVLFKEAGNMYKDKNDKDYSKNIRDYVSRGLSRLKMIRKPFIINERL